MKRKPSLSVKRSLQFSLANYLAWMLLNAVLIGIAVLERPLSLDFGVDAWCLCISVASLALLLPARWIARVGILGGIACYQIGKHFVGIHLADDSAAMICLGTFAGFLIRCYLENPRLPLWYSSFREWIATIYGSKHGRAMWVKSLGRHFARIVNRLVVELASWLWPKAGARNAKPAEANIESIREEP